MWKPWIVRSRMRYSSCDVSEKGCGWASGRAAGLYPGGSESFQGSGLRDEPLLNRMFRPTAEAPHSYCFGELSLFREKADVFGRASE